MNRFCQRRLHTRLSILVIVSLLWSQFVLASHPVASMSGMAFAPDAASAAMQHGCDHPDPIASAAVCKAHCGRGAQSNDIVRIPPVPALAPALAMGFASIVTLKADRVPCSGFLPSVSRHRPTAHPACLLLI